MDFRKSEQIRKDWEEKKEKNPNLTCDHPNGFEPETMGGGKTEDFICPICGYEASREERNKWRKEHEK